MNFLILTVDDEGIDEPSDISSRYGVFMNNLISADSSRYETLMNYLLSAVDMGH